MAKESLLEEIRRVRHELDKKMKRDPQAIHKLSQKAMRKFRIHPYLFAQLAVRGKSINESIE